MAKAFGNSWLRVLAVLMSVVVLATPAMAGFATAKVLSDNLKANNSGCTPCTEIANTIMNDPQLKTLFGGKDPSKSQLGEGRIRQVQELTEASLVRVAKTALTDSQVKALSEELAKRGYVLAKEKVRAAKLTAEFENKTLAKKEEVVTTIVTLPLLNDAKETATISFVSNKFGTGAAALVKEGGSPAIMVYDATKGRLIVMPLSSLTCWVCKQIVLLICNWPQTLSCYIMCGSVCLVFIESPPAMVICNLICNPICRYVTRTPGSCDSAYTTCVNVGYCP